MLAVRRVRKVACLDAGTSKPAIQTLVRPPIVIKPLFHRHHRSTRGQEEVRMLKDEVRTWHRLSGLYGLRGGPGMLSRVGL